MGGFSFCKVSITLQKASVSESLDIMFGNKVDVYNKKSVLYASYH